MYQLEYFASTLLAELKQFAARIEPAWISDHC